MTVLVWNSISPEHLYAEPGYVIWTGIPAALGFNSIGMCADLGDYHTIEEAKTEAQQWHDGGSLYRSGREGR